VTGTIRIGLKDYAVKKNIKRGHAYGLGEGSQLCEQNGSVPVGRVTQANMEIFIREEWAKVEEATWMIITSSGLMAITDEEGLVVMEDVTYVWDPFHGLGSPAHEEGLGFLH
jgi:hypothetical protein